MSACARRGSRSPLRVAVAAGILAVCLVGPAVTVPAGPREEPPPEVGGEVAELLRRDWYAVDRGAIRYLGNVKKRDFLFFVDQMERFRLHVVRSMPNLARTPGVPTSIYILHDETLLESIAGPGRVGMYFEIEDHNLILMLGHQETIVTGGWTLESTKDELLPHLFHEYTHYLFRNAWLPLWLNEGLADYFSATRISGHDIEFGYPIAGRQVVVEESGIMDLQVLATVGMNDRRYRGDESLVAEFYASAWAFTHFLLNAPGDHQDDLRNYLARFNEDGDSVAAFAAVFGAETAELQQEVNDYITRRKLPGKRKKSSLSRNKLEAESVSPVERMVLAGDICLALGAEDDAEALYGEALRRSPASRGARAGLARVHLARQEAVQAEAVVRDLASSAPPGPLIPWLHGKALLQVASEMRERGGEVAGKADDVARLARTRFMASVVADAEFAPGLQYYGKTFLMLEDLDGSGLKALRLAAALEPDRREILMDLSRLLRLSGAREEAFAVAAHLDLRAASPWEESMVREFLAIDLDAARLRIDQADLAGARALLETLVERIPTHDIELSAAYATLVQAAGGP